MTARTVTMTMTNATPAAAPNDRRVSVSDSDAARAPVSFTRTLFSDFNRRPTAARKSCVSIQADKTQAEHRQF